MKPVIVAMLIAIFGTIAGSGPGSADEPQPFAKLLGRWVGDGRFGTRSGETETVKCRVTYRTGVTANELKQTIRCAAKSGSIEVAADVTDTAGTLSGTWVETTRNWSGSLSGAATKAGFKVSVKGPAFSANMDVIVNDNQQVIEVHLFDNAILGLTLILAKG